MKQTALLLLTLLLATSCYEDRIACLDVTATNFDILADEACPDCCEYPSLSIDLERANGLVNLSLDTTFFDAAGNEVRLIDLRGYLTDATLLDVNDLEFPATTTATEVRALEGTDTVLTDLDRTVVLLTTTGTAGRTVGRIRTGEALIDAARFTVGFGPTFPAVVPASAPASAPLSPQPRLLNFNDGAGYQSLSLEYELVATGEVRRVNVYADSELLLPLPGVLEPLPGADLTLEMRLDYQTLINDLNLAADDATVAADLPGAFGRAISITGVR